MKKYIIRIISIICLILTFFVIFNFSSQDGEISGGLSRNISTEIIELYDFKGNLNFEEKKEKVDIIEPIIRKLAHLSIYTVVGICLMSLLYTYNMKFKNRIILGSLIGMIYAISDEIHQSFTPGRGPAIVDVCIDTIGVAIGLFIVCLIINIYNKVNKRNIVIE